MREVASLPRVEVIPPQFRDFVNGVMLFEIALTVNPLAFEGFGEVYEPVLRLSLAGFRHPSLSGPSL